MDVYIESVTINVKTVVHCFIYFHIYNENRQDHSSLVHVYNILK